MKSARGGQYVDDKYLEDDEGGYNEMMRKASIFSVPKFFPDKPVSQK